MVVIQDIIDPVYEAIMNSLTGIIWMFSGLTAAVPEGWAICDGNNGTPDLRSRFLYGASIDGDVENTGGGLTHRHVVNDGGHFHDVIKHKHLVDACNHTVTAHQHNHTHPLTESSGSTTCDMAGEPGDGGVSCSHKHRWESAIIHSSSESPGTTGDQPYTDEKQPNTDVEMVTGNTDRKRPLPTWIKLFFIMKL